MLTIKKKNYVCQCKLPDGSTCGQVHPVNLDIEPGLAVAIVVFHSLWIYTFGSGTPWCVLTSANDDHHRVFSNHYAGEAVDFRAHHIKLEQARAIASTATLTFGGTYRAILEGTPGTPNYHFHVEPVRPTNLKYRNTDPTGRTTPPDPVS